MLIGSAKVLVDNVPEESGLERLVGMVKFFYGVYKASNKYPENN